jgi:hypothetical protein
LSVTSRTSEALFTILPVSTTPLEPLASSTAPTRYNGDGSRTTQYVTVSHQPSATSTVLPSSINQRSLPVATIAGAAVGGLVLITLIIFLLICFRRRKRKNIYQAPIYISPYNTTSSVRSQKLPIVYKTDLRRSCDQIQQLDSTNVDGTRSMARDSARRFAELAAEPVMRPI